MGSNPLKVFGRDCYFLAFAQYAARYSGLNFYKHVKIIHNLFFAVKKENSAFPKTLCQIEITGGGPSKLPFVRLASTMKPHLRGSFEAPMKATDLGWKLGAG